VFELDQKKYPVFYPSIYGMSQKNSKKLLQPEGKWVRKCPMQDICDEYSEINVT
jgi:hypothetical protein